MTVTYTTADIVASLMQVDPFETGDDPSGKNEVPSLEEVERFINEAEDEIDRRTRHAWRAVQITDEYHSLSRGQLRRRFGYRRFGATYNIYTKRKPLRTFVSGTDKIEIFDGDDFTDLISGDFNEGREEDYFIVEPDGKIMIRGQWPTFRESSIRITYKHGEATVPGDIQKAATMMTAIDLINNSNFTHILPSGGDHVKLLEKIEQWEDKIDRILARHEEHIAPGS